MLFRMYDMGKASHAHAQNWVHLKFLVLKSFSKNLKKANPDLLRKCIKEHLVFGGR